MSIPTDSLLVNHQLYLYTILDIDEEEEIFLDPIGADEWREGYIEYNQFKYHYKYFVNGVEFQIGSGIEMKSETQLEILGRIKETYTIYQQSYDDDLITYLNRIQMLYKEEYDMFLQIKNIYLVMKEYLRSKRTIDRLIELYGLFTEEDESEEDEEEKDGVLKSFKPTRRQRILIKKNEKDYEKFKTFKEFCESVVKKDDDDE